MDPYRELGRTLLILGGFLVLIGSLLYFGGKLPLRLGKLPGDISPSRRTRNFLFPHHHLPGRQRGTFHLSLALLPLPPLVASPISPAPPLS